MIRLVSTFILVISFCHVFPQERGKGNFQLTKKDNGRIDILLDQKLFTSFLYPDTLEKPILYPVIAGDGRAVTRGFPMAMRPNEPTDHPHHVGVWFTFENVNDLDFWNNSYAIAPEKKANYGWIRTDSILKIESGEKGILVYHANWTHHAKDILLEEITTLVFSGSNHQRIIDRSTTFIASRDVTFKDAKDGMYAIRLAHELQIPETADKSFTDAKGNVTTIKAKKDDIATGDYLTSAGKTGNDTWSSRAAWCKSFGKIGPDSVSVTIIDHPENINYPTFWHARGYGLFAANPLGTNIFTEGKSETNLHLNKDESITFKYRMVIQDGATTLSAAQLNKLADDFAKMDL